MFLALSEAGLSENLVKVIAQVHMSTRCDIVHGNSTGHVFTQKGLRQGCPIAPLVYSAWSARFIRQLNERLRATWGIEHITIYADDNLLSWKIDGCRSLDRACREITTVVQVLEDLGMEVSSGKSEAVLALKGTKQLHTLAKHTCTRAGVSCLVACSGGKRLYIPVKT